MVIALVSLLFTLSAEDASASTAAGTMMSLSRGTRGKLTLLLLAPSSLCDSRFILRGEVEPKLRLSEHETFVSSLEAEARCSWLELVDCSICFSCIGEGEPLDPELVLVEAFLSKSLLLLLLFRARLCRGTPPTKLVVVQVESAGLLMRFGCVACWTWRCILCWLVWLCWLVKVG